MTCIPCSQRIAPGAWASSYKGGPPQSGEGQGGNLCVANGSGAAAFLRALLEPMSPNVAHSAPLRLSLRLACFVRCVKPVSPARLWKQRGPPRIVPGGGTTGEGCGYPCLPSWAAQGALRPAELGRSLCPETGTCPSRPDWCFRSCTAVFQEPCRQLASGYGTAG